MAEVLDCKGFKCPKPVLKLAIKANSIAPGTTLEVHADCSSFPTDVKKWCDSSGNRWALSDDRTANPSSWPLSRTLA